jgi:hypothetical protein
MYYAVIYALVVNGTPYTLVEPMSSLSQCRAVAAVMQKNRTEQYPDAQCVALIFDKGEK